MAAKQIDTIIGSYSVIPNSQTRPGTFSEDRDTYLAEEQDIIYQKNQVSEETNEVSTEINETSLQVAQNAQQVATDTASASLSASIAIGQANYKGDWIAGFETVGYSLNDSVSYTDGLNYVSKIDNNLTEPTTGTNTTEWNFIEAIDPNSVYTKTETDDLLDDKLDKNLLVKQPLNPTQTTNPTTTGAIVINTTSGEVFTCTDNTTDDNKWLGTDGTVVPQPILNNIFGRLWNQTDDTYKRVGLDVTKFTQDTQAEFRKWLTPTAKRVNDNDIFDHCDLTQELNTNTALPFATIRRMVVDTAGDTEEFDHETLPSATEQIMTQIEKCYYIDALVVSDGKQYDVKLTSKSSFTIDLESDLGFNNITSITTFNPAAGISSGTVSGNTIVSALHPAFVWSTGADADLTFAGSFWSISGRSTFGAKPTASITLPTARTQNSSFGTNFGQHDIWNNALIQLLAYIERGTNWLEGSGTKWDGNSNTYVSSNYQFDNGLTLDLKNNTGVIKDNRNRTIANSYRGVENYHSGLYVWIDAINIYDGVSHLAKAGNTFVSDTDAAPYFNSGLTTTTTAAWRQIKEWFAGTFIPNPTSAGTTTSKVTDQMYGNTGWRVLRSGGNLFFPGISGLSCWSGPYDSSYADWGLVSRSSFRKFF